MITLSMIIKSKWGIYEMALYISTVKKRKYWCTKVKTSDAIANLGKRNMEIDGMKMVLNIVSYCTE